MPIETFTISRDQVVKILSKDEGHFSDFKAKEISPARLTKSLSAFANADGGELYIGIEENKGKFEWNGFKNVEEANAHVQVIEQSFPLGNSFRYSFLTCKGVSGAVLQCEIEKTRDIKFASDGKAYLRRGAQNLPQDTDEKVSRLKYSKGISSFEDEKIQADIFSVANSLAIIEFALEIIPTAEPETWLRKQNLIIDNRPTVAGAVLFSDEPQVSLPKAAIKLYRYKTNEPVGTRERAIAESW